jgi:hypothetical protein
MVDLDEVTAGAEDQVLIVPECGRDYEKQASRLDTGTVPFAVAADESAV